MYFKTLAIVAVSVGFQLTACSGGGDQCQNMDGDFGACTVAAPETGQALEQPVSGEVGAEVDAEVAVTPDSDNIDTVESEVTEAIETEGVTAESVVTEGTEPVGAETDSTVTESTETVGTETEIVVVEGTETNTAEIEIVETEDAEIVFGEAQGSVLGPVASGSTESAGSTSTPDPSGPFSKFQLDDVLYTNNVYDGRQLNANDNWRLISYDGVQDFVNWSVPVVSAAHDDPCSHEQPFSDVLLNYRLTSKKDSVYERNTFVRSFPTMVVGTMGGRYESWGVECGNSSQLSASAQRTGNSPVYDMTRVAPETGFPMLAGDLNSSVLMSVKGDIHSGAAANGIANIFVDSYWHNVSNAELLPGGDTAFKDTINGINSDVTETWNLNIWFDWPRHEGSVSSWTGGFKIGQVELSNNEVFDVYFKLEGARTGILPDCRLGGEDNCFLYIGLVTTDLNAGRDGITIDYLEISNWMKSAEFRDLFLSGAYETDTPNAKAYSVWKLIDGTENDNNADPASRGPRFPDDQHVIGGLHMGSELWFNPDAQEAEIRFSAMGIYVDGLGTFGSFEDFR